MFGQSDPSVNPSSSYPFSSVSGDNVVVASQVPGLYGNSNLTTGGGTDDTGVIQQILDKLSANGGGKFIIDSVCLVSGLLISSNTTIEGCGWTTGFYRMNGADIPVFRGKNPTTSTVIDNNIQFINFSINGNGTNNPSPPKPSELDLFTQGIAFYGATNLVFDRINFNNVGGGSGYAYMFTNTKYVLFRDCQVNTSNDAIHFVGPNSKLRFYNIYGNAGSDFIALNSSDYHNQGTAWMTIDGDITDVVIDGLYLNLSANGIGLLSNLNNIKDVSIRNVHGTVLAWAISFWNFWNSAGTGTIDNVTIDNCSAIGYAESGVTQQCVIYFGGYGSSGQPVRVKGVQITNSSWINDTTTRPYIYLDTTSIVEDLQISNAIVGENPVNTNNRAFIKSLGVATFLTLNGLNWSRPLGSTLSSYVLDGAGVITNASIATQEVSLLNGVINSNVVITNLNQTSFGGDVNSATKVTISNPNASLQLIDSTATGSGLGLTLLSRADTNNVATLTNRVLNPNAGNAATGGSITTTGSYKVHKFTAGSNLVVPAGGIYADLLLVGGGGGGAAGGGGGGEVVYLTNQFLPAGTLPVVVGGGGAAGATTNPGTNGSPGVASTFNGNTAQGGGGGGGINITPAGNGGSSGGAGSNGSTLSNPGSVTASQGVGHTGGTNSSFTTSPFPSGGGGGAGLAGQNAQQNTVSGYGGIGVLNSIDFSTVTYYGGGGGGANFSAGNTNGVGGLGGGGNGGDAVGTAGTVNTGGGGGGSNNTGVSGAGGSGIVIVRYFLPGALQDASLISSQDSTVIGVKGVTAFGDAAGYTHILGMDTTVANTMQPASSVTLPISSSLVLAGTLVLASGVKVTLPSGTRMALI